MCELVGLKPAHRILDVGSGNGLSFEIFNKENEITGLDLDAKTSIKRNKFKYVQGDGSDMHMFKNKEFDLVVCVGVFEHVHPYEKMRNMAEEIRRIGKGYVILIPHFWTIIEPHYQVPFWQLYPRSLKMFLTKHFNLGNYYKNEKGEYEVLNYFRKSGWEKLFPDGEVFSYNHIGPGIIKNFIVFRKINA